MKTTPTSAPKAPPKAGPPAAPEVPAAPRTPPVAAGEVGGPKGLEPTRYGDWERGGRCIDF